MEHERREAIIATIEDALIPKNPRRDGEDQKISTRQVFTTAVAAIMDNGFKIVEMTAEEFEARKKEIRRRQ
ncbi:MAG: hypothetical protein KDB18_12025 [Salinibacterium sp.]|nr:hypothetical protein [Salinibacterium sp.]